MTKLENASDLTVNNFEIETVDLVGSNFSVTAASNQISVTGASFLDVNGDASNLAFDVNDIIRITFADPSNTNNGTARVTAVAANQLTIADHTGTLVNQGTGEQGNIHRIRKTFRLIRDVDNLVYEDGVTLNAIAGRLAQLFDAGDLEKFDPPYTETIPFAGSINFINGWEPFDQETIEMIREGAISISDGVTGLVEREYMSVNSAALSRTTHRPWYWFQNRLTGVPIGDPVDSVTAGYMDQLILIKDDDAGIDRTGDHFIVKVAEAGYPIQFINETDVQAITVLRPQIYRLGIGDRGIDLKLADTSGNPLVSDTIIETTLPYTAFTYTRYAAGNLQARLIDGVSYDFDAIIERDNGSADQIHAWLHWQARRRPGDNTFIDTGSTLRGHFAPAISSFLGEQVTFIGYADNTPSNENNDTVHIDAAGNPQRTAREAAFTLDFRVGQLLAPAGSADFNVYLQSNYNTPDAAIVQNKDGVNMEGSITGDQTEAFSISFSTFNQQGHPPNTPIPIRVTLSAPGLLLPRTYDFTVQDNTTQIFSIDGIQTTVVV